MYFLNLGVKGLTDCPTGFGDQQSHVRHAHSAKFSLPPLYVSLLGVERMYFLNLGVKG